MKRWVFNDSNSGKPFVLSTAELPGSILSRHRAARVYEIRPLYRLSNHTSHLAERSGVRDARGVSIATCQPAESACLSSSVICMLCWLLFVRQSVDDYRDAGSSPAGG